MFDNFIGKKILDSENSLKEYCDKNKLNLAIMEMADVNIDVEPDRLCCWIDNEGIIQKFTQG